MQEFVYWLLFVLLIVVLLVLNFILKDLMFEQKIKRIKNILDKDKFNH